MVDGGPQASASPGAKAHDGQCRALHEAIAAHLSARADLAFIVDAHRVVFARGCRPAHGPVRPVLDLLLGIHEAFGDDAFRLIRRRIYSTGPEDPLDRALVQICASKLSAGIGRRAGPLPPHALVDIGGAAKRVREHALREGRLELPVTSALRPEQLVALVRRLAQALPTGGSGSGDGLPRHRRHRAVAAMLADARGVPRLAARNLNGTHRPLHAEVNLLLQWWEQTGTAIPAGWRVVTSLQSCRMCAAMLVHCSSGTGIEALYAEPDAGRFSRCTALQERGWERHVAAGRHFTDAG